MQNPTRVQIIDAEKKRWEKSYDLLCLSQVAAVEGNLIFKTANPVFESLNVYSTYMLIKCSSPLDVVQQFANLIGHTAAMAYWASGLSPLDAVQQFTDHRGHIAVMPYWASGMSIDALLYNFFGVALYCLLAFKYLQNLRIIYTSKAKVSAS
ncbi:hypothetical protein SUGI_0423630 [Cryptomeria japonica]|nr:hypothetical protein SUGI_0423630 [Cryptomeria japonica]